MEEDILNYLYQLSCFVGHPVESMVGILHASCSDHILIKYKLLRLYLLIYKNRKCSDLLIIHYRNQELPN